MNWFNDTASSLSASTRLLLHDRDGLSDFNNTVSGFWHSFSAILLIAPLYLFVNSIFREPATTGANFTVQSHMLVLILQWVLWPVVMIFATRWAGLSQHFSRYVIVYNWSNVLLMAFLSIPALLFRFGVLSLEGATVATGAFQLITFYLEWYLARLSLDTKGMYAGAVVLGNLVLSVGILQLIS